MEDAQPASATYRNTGPGAVPWREPVRGGHPSHELAARPGSEFLRALLAGEVPQPPLSRLTGMRLVEIGPRSATFTMPLSRWLCGPDGTIPLGPLTIPADAAMACAIISELPEATTLTTSEMALRQVRPARPGGSVWARASVLEAGPPLALAEVSLTDDDGLLIGHGSSLCVTLPFTASPSDTEDAAGSEADDGAPPDPWQRADPEAGLAPLTGLRPVHADRGEATFALPATRWLCAPPPGRVQGGAVAMLADAAITAAIRTAASGPDGFTPIELKLNYLRPLSSDGREARAHARLIHAGRRIGVASADVVDADGRPIAVATGSALAQRAVAAPPDADGRTAPSR